jgi:uncharacterized protein YbjT (DUF2867 family)
LRAEPLRPYLQEVAVGDALEPSTLGRAVDGVQMVISCVGAPIEFSLKHRRGYLDVDVHANVNLIEAARRAGVTRFVYVAVHTQSGYAQTSYIRAHETVVRCLERSGLKFAVVRPTGIFPIFEPFVEMARRGLLWFPGNGTAKTNPVHPADVALACVEGLTVPDGTSTSVGGPDILTREEIARMACEATDRSPRILHVPERVLVASSVLLRPMHPRVSELLEFAVRVFTTDCVAPRAGRHRLVDYFAQVARATAPGPDPISWTG